MTNEVNNQNPHHIENLENEVIDGKNVMGGGGGDIDHNDVPALTIANGPTEIGYSTDVVPLEDPIFAGNGILSSEAPPVVTGPGYTATPGFQNGNT